jgi:hypothetical protein
MQITHCHHHQKEPRERKRKTGRDRMRSKYFNNLPLCLYVVNHIKFIKNWYTPKKGHVCSGNLSVSSLLLMVLICDKNKKREAAKKNYL